MTNISRIQKAVLINWKGMFYQPFEIDPAMTLLEGANGTGKTTIMIAIYTCLIPDLNFLNFQNVTAVSSRKNEDKGLFGRIGQEGGHKDEPIYTLLDIVTSTGNRVLIGVQIVKKTYPHVGLKHFAITGLSLQEDIDRLLIYQDNNQTQQQLLELEEIGDACAKAGGELVSFRHAKDYFQFLFDNDISPIRLIENEERKKYNQLLHTSLYGGLSRTLQTSLRDYLLPENDKLVQGIHEMEQNLKTCRRTKAAIQRYQSVREIISQVYNTGLALYQAAYNATRLEAEQKVKSLLQLRKERSEVKQQLKRCTADIEAADTQTRKLQQAFDQTAGELDLAAQGLNRSLNASRIVNEIEEKENQYRKLQEEEASVRSRFEALKKERDQLQEKEQTLGSRRIELAKQMSDAGQAWQELSKEVGLYQQAENLLKEARQQLPELDLSPDTISPALETVQSSFEQARNSHQEAYLALNDARIKQEQFSSYHQLLCQLLEEEVPPEAAGKKAKELLAELQSCEKRLQEADDLSVRMGRLNEAIANKERLVKALTTVGLDSISSESDFDQARDTVLTSLKTIAQKQKTIQQELDNSKSEKRSFSEKLPALKKQLGDWDRFQKTKTEVENRTAFSIESLRDLTSLQNKLDEQLQKRYLERYDLKSKQKRIQQAYNTLLNEGTAVPGLRLLTEQGFGTLLADRYEEIPAEWSANLESRLGPLSHALVVKDIHKTANQLTASFDRPDDLWLVQDTHKEKLPEAIELGDSILVKHGDAWRLSRLPTDPAFGKEARSKRLELLSDEIRSYSSALESCEGNIKNLKENLDLVHKLSLMDAFLSASSPLNQVSQLQEQQTQVEKQIEQSEQTLQRLQEQMTELEAQEDVLRQFYPLKQLLDQTDLEKVRSQLQEEWENARQLEERYKKKLPYLPRLQQGIDILNNPLEQELDTLKQSESAAKAELEKKRQQKELLERLHERRDYFRHKDRVQLLEKEKSINQHTESQLKEVEEEHTRIRQSLQTSDTELKDVTERFHKAEAELNTLKGQLDLLKKNLAEAGASGSAADLENARSMAASLEGKKAELEAQINAQKENRYKLDAEKSQLEDSLGKKASQFKSRFTAARPAMRRWSHFHRQARKDARFKRLEKTFKEDIQNAADQAEVYWRKVSALRVTLISTLEKIHDAATVLERIREINESDLSEQDPSSATLAIWQQIQGYVRQVIPVDLQTTDPEEAQHAIGLKLESLEQNLEQQESSLRIHVQSIPSHLNAEIRKQKSRIRKLNEKLATIRFGFLQSIRIHLETQPKLKRFLDILPQQLDIFAESAQENVSIESLMADLYEREGAGKVRGDLLMDYRHYVRLSIEVKREGNQDFEKVTSTNLSTGESIGVGIAILIMVLMSWEEQSHLTGDAEQRGSLRFLLLDESSRLDQQALQTLSEFCSNLGLQLLIAAPSVERTLRGTTHHLTRSHFNGREEVVVRGRRITATAAS